MDDIIIIIITYRLRSLMQIAQKEARIDDYYIWSNGIMTTQRTLVGRDEERVEIIKCFELD